MLKDPKIKRIRIVLCLPSLSEIPPITGPNTNLATILKDNNIPVNEAIPILVPSMLIPSEPTDSMRYKDIVDEIVVVDSKRIKYGDLVWFESLESSGKMNK